jgi:hypothetical protein
MPYAWGLDWVRQVIHATEHDQDDPPEPDCLGKHRQTDETFGGPFVFFQRAMNVQAGFVSGGSG